MRLFRPTFIGSCLYPEALFRIKTTEKILCLTFDDGPDPDSSLQLLEVLNKYKIKALFFCDGRAAEKHPEIIDKIKSKGNIIGNHGYNHLNGCNTPLKEYITDIENAARYTSSTLFRPPYGRLSRSQYRNLQQRYKIVFWDIMAYDFDTSFGKENSLKILKKKIRPGSIIVLHDKVSSCAGIILDEFLAHAVKSGYRFEIPEF